MVGGFNGGYMGWLVGLMVVIGGLVGLMMVIWGGWWV